MGWGKIKRAIHKVADPLKITDRIDKLKIVKNIKAEGTKGVAQYGAAAGTVAQFIPVVGTAVGAGLIAGSVAANIKLKQEAIAKQNRENARLAGVWATEAAANLASANGAASQNDVTFTPVTPDGAVSGKVGTDPLGRGGPYGGNYNNFAHGAGNILNNLFPADVGDRRAVMTGAAPSPDAFAPGTTSRDILTGSAEPNAPFVERHKIGLYILAAVAVAGVVIFAIKR